MDQAAKNKEEQLLEVEALQAIYGEDKMNVTDEEISLFLTPSLADPNVEICHVKLTFCVVLTEHYPEAVPFWSLREVVGLDKFQIEAIEAELRDIAESNVGTPVIYLMTESILAYMGQKNHPPKSMHDEMLGRETTQRQTKKVIESDENSDATSDSDYAPRHGSSSDSDDDDDDDSSDDGNTGGLQAKELCSSDKRITEEEFMRWSQQFRADKIRSGAWTESGIGTNPTGKQIFEALAASGVDKNMASLGGDLCDNPDLFQDDLNDLCLSD